MNVCVRVCVCVYLFHKTLARGSMQLTKIRLYLYSITFYLKSLVYRSFTCFMTRKLNDCSAGVRWLSVHFSTELMILILNDCFFPRTVSSSVTQNLTFNYNLFFLCNLNINLHLPATYRTGSRNSPVSNCIYLSLFFESVFRSMQIQLWTFVDSSKY